MKYLSSSGVADDACVSPHAPCSSWWHVAPHVSPKALSVSLGILLLAWMAWVAMALLIDDHAAATLTEENGLFQALTVFCYVFAGVVFVWNGIWWLKIRRRGFYKWWAIILGLGCVFVAGEEINWGQTYLHFRTPAVLEHANLQQEFSLHNVRLPGPLSSKHWANELLWWLAACGGVVFPIGLIFSSVFRRWVSMVAFPVPPWLTQAYCLAATTIPRDGQLIGHLSRDNIPSELRELTIAVAIAVWAWAVWQRNRHDGSVHEY
jgi:hypothetical protein